MNQILLDGEDAKDIVYPNVTIALRMGVNIYTLVKDGVINFVK